LSWYLLILDIPIRPLDPWRWDYVVPKRR
jgi:hypothetical protein